MWYVYMYIVYMEEEGIEFWSNNNNNNFNLAFKVLLYNSGVFLLLSIKLNSEMKREDKKV